MRPTAATISVPRSSAVAPTRRAFTLVEIMVVIGILVILVGLLLVSTTSLLSGSKGKQTLLTMQTVEQAIRLYREDQALLRSNQPLRAWQNPKTSAWQLEAAPKIFGPWPPSPICQFATDPDTKPRVVYPTWGTDPPWTNETDAVTVAKFHVLIRLAMGWMPDPNDDKVVWKQGTPTGPPAIPTPTPDRDAVTSECLLLFLTTQSTSAKKVIDKLPDSAKANRDKDLVYLDLDKDGKPDVEEKQSDLYELIDAWGNPIRYHVKEPMYEIDTQTGNKTKQDFEAIWELRSAGPNGVFAEPFTPDDGKDAVGVADDVVLRSQ